MNKRALAHLHQTNPCTKQRVVDRERIMLFKVFIQVFREKAKPSLIHFFSLLVCFSISHYDVWVASVRRHDLSCCVMTDLDCILHIQYVWILGAVETHRIPVNIVFFIVMFQNEPNFHTHPQKSGG